MLMPEAAPPKIGALTSGVASIQMIMEYQRFHSNFNIACAVVSYDCVAIRTARYGGAASVALRPQPVGPTAKLKRRYAGSVAACPLIHLSLALSFSGNMSLAVCLSYGLRLAICCLPRPGAESEKA
eukprot:6197001-Pleurochrysis_carterae.AAC.1